MAIMKMSMRKIREVLRLADTIRGYTAMNPYRAGQGGPM
jgi:hypothetical protein